MLPLQNNVEISKTKCPCLFVYKKYNHCYCHVITVSSKRLSVCNKKCPVHKKKRLVPKKKLSGEKISETLPLVQPVRVHKFRNFVFRNSPQGVQIQKCLISGTPLCDTLLDFVDVKMNIYRRCCNIFTDSVQKESVTFTILCPERVYKFYQTVF